MKIRTIYEFEPDDMARPHHVETVMNMLGIKHLPPGEDGKPPQEKRAFNRLLHGLGTSDDVAEINKIVAERSAALRERAQTERPFFDDVANTHYADSLMATAYLAEREWRTFLDLLADDIALATGSAEQAHAYQ